MRINRDYCSLVVGCRQKHPALRTVRISSTNTASGVRKAIAIRGRFLQAQSLQPIDTPHNYTILATRELLKSGDSCIVGTPRQLPSTSFITVCPSYKVFSGGKPSYETLRYRYAPALHHYLSGSNVSICFIPTLITFVDTLS